MSRIADIKAELRELFAAEEGRHRARGSENEVLRVYCRVGKKPMRRDLYELVITLASIDVLGDNHGTGLKNELFDFLEAYVKEDTRYWAVYVECVNNPNMIPGLIRRGYVIRQDANPLGNGLCGDWYKLAEKPARDSWAMSFEDATASAS
jgi:hypothetical protein